MVVQPTVLETFQFVFVIVTLPLYIIFMVTIIRFRHKPPFNGEFFKLCLSLGCADLCAMINNWVLIKFPLFDWMGIGNAIRAYNKTLATLHVMLAWQLGLTQAAHVTVLAVSRATAFVWTEKHLMIWTKRFVSGTIVALWLLPLVVVIPQLWLPFGYKLDNQTGEVLSAPLFLDNYWLKFYFIGGLFYLTTINVLTMVMYLLSFWNVRQQLQSTNTGIDNQTNNSDIKLLLLGFFLFAVLFFYSMFQLSMVLMPATDEAAYNRNVLVYSLISDIFSCCNPWLSIIVAPTVRKHMFSIVMCKQPETNVVVPALVNKSQPKPQLKPRTAVVHHA